MGEPGTVWTGKYWVLAKSKRELHPAWWGGEELTLELDLKDRVHFSRQRGDAMWEMPEGFKGWLPGL